MAIVMVEASAYGIDLTHVPRMGAEWFRKPCHVSMCFFCSMMPGHMINGMVGGKGIAERR